MEFFFPIKSKQGVNNHFKPLNHLSQLFRLKSEQKEKNASNSKNRVTEENVLTSIHFIDRVVYPRALFTSYNLRFTRQERVFNYDASKLFNLEIKSSLVLEGKKLLGVRK